MKPVYLPVDVYMSGYRFARFYSESELRFYLNCAVDSGRDVVIMPAQDTDEFPRFIALHDSEGRQYKFVNDGRFAVDGYKSHRITSREDIVLFRFYDAPIT